LKADARLGLLGFRPTFGDYLQLISQLLRDGGGILLKHSRLLGLFLEAITDNLLDFRFRRGPVTSSVRISAWGERSSAIPATNTASCGLA